MKKVVISLVLGGRKYDYARHRRESIKNENCVVISLVLEGVASRNHSNYCVSEKHK